MHACDKDQENAYFKCQRKPVFVYCLKHFKYISRKRRFSISSKNYIYEKEARQKYITANKHIKYSFGEMKYNREKNKNGKINIHQLLVIQAGRLDTFLTLESLISAVAAAGAAAGAVDKFGLVPYGFGVP